INLKFLKSLPTEWRTHTLIWRNKTDLEEQSLDDFFNSLKIYEAGVKSSSPASTSTQNIAFVSSQNTDSTNEPVSDVASVSAASAKIPVSALPNQIDADDLEEMDLKWQMAMLTVRARRFLQRTERNLRANGPTSMGFDMSKVECYNCHRKGHFARECRSPKNTRRNVAAEPQRMNVPSHYDKLTNDLRKLQFDVISYKTGLESVEARLLVYQQNETVFEEDIKLLKLDVKLRDNALVVLRQKFKKAKQERNDLKLKLEKFQTSSQNFKYQSGEGYHGVPPPYTGTFMPPKPDLVFHDAPNVELPQNAPSFVQTTKQVKAPRPSVKPAKNSIMAANHKTAIPKPKSHRNNKNRKACFVCKSLTHLIKDCDYYEKKIAQTPARNHAQRGNH
nr:hypothetical protein [Tanacetum cinerariifolium]